MPQANKCTKHFLSTNKAQLISVIDASFKPNPGILRGNVNWMGNYRECMKADDLHYCAMTNVVLSLGQFIPLTLELRLPEQCNSDGVTEIFILLGILTGHDSTSFIIINEITQFKNIMSGLFIIHNLYSNLCGSDAV